MTGKEILNIFGFKVKEEPLSIYPYSPVYQVKHGDDDVVVKRTQSRAESIMSYIKMLKGKGINVVTPVELQVHKNIRIKILLFIRLYKEKNTQAKNKKSMKLEKC